MFDIGFQELLLIGVLALLIMGPERLPGAVRTATLWLSRLRRSFQQIKTDIEREIGVDELKQQLHNESIMQNLEDTKNAVQKDIRQAADTLKPDLDNLPYDINNIMELTPSTPDDHNANSSNKPSRHHE